jgi:sulfur carrier protein ThiS
MLRRSALENSVAKVVLASALARWLPQTAASEGGEVSLDIPGSTVADALEHLFAQHPVLRGYVVDERGALRRHVALFVDGTAIHHNSDLQQALGEHAEVYVMQALSGG